jgi:dolichol-phosphate mannosyltransferase
MKKKGKNSHLHNFYDVTIIIPTYNEEGNIGKLVKVLKRLMPGVKVIVSDDGSKDDTQNIARKCSATVIDRSNERIHGLTISAMDAINACKSKFFVVIDADFQHPPEKIKHIVDRLRKGAEVVVGNRIKIPRDWGIHRHIISKTAKCLGHMRLTLRKHLPLHHLKYDIMSGFFGGKTETAKNIISSKHHKFEHKGYKVLFDMLKYLPHNTTIDKVDYEFGTRSTGTSKLSMKIMFYYLRSCFK